MKERKGEQACTGRDHHALQRRARLASRGRHGGRRAGFGSEPGTQTPLDACEVFIPRLLARVSQEGVERTIVFR